MEGNFSESDRATLITLSVDMGYTKRAVEELGKELLESGLSVKREIADLWRAIDTLQKFQWGLMGGISMASVMLGLLGGYLVRKLGGG